jgi:hypothetical protein
MSFGRRKTTFGFVLDGCGWYRSLPSVEVWLSASIDV